MVGAIGESLKDELAPVVGITRIGKPVE